VFLAEVLAIVRENKLLAGDLYRCFGGGSIIGVLEQF
jgi:hypothetical protein